MSQAPRKRRLFPRTLHEVVSQATNPMLDKQGKLYGALIRDWPVIVGEAHAAISSPARLQFPTSEMAGAILHLNVHPAHAPQLQYATAQLIEQCARYFGYKAIERIVLHADHAQVTLDSPTASKPKETAPERTSAEEMKAMFAALRRSIESGDDK